MPLNKQTISVPFSQGLETKTDDLQENLDGFEVLENVIFDTPNQIRKRRGYNLLDLRTPNESLIENPRYLAQYEDELGIMNNTCYYSYSESIERWINKGRIFTAFPTTENIIRNFRTKQNLDIVTVENISFFSYQDNSGIRLSAKDNENCNFIISDVLLTESGTNPKITNIQNSVVVFYTVENEIRYKTVNITNPSIISEEFTFSTALGAINTNYDVLQVNNSIAVAFNSAALARTVSLQENYTIQSQGIGSLRDSGQVTFQVNPPSDNPSNTVIIEGLGDIQNTTISVTPNTGFNNPANGVSTATLNTNTPITLTNNENITIPETVSVNRNGTNINLNINEPTINDQEEVIVEFSGNVNNINLEITPNLRTNSNPRASSAVVLSLASGFVGIVVFDETNPESRNGDGFTLDLNRTSTGTNTGAWIQTSPTSVTFSLDLNSADFPNLITVQQLADLMEQGTQEIDDTLISISDSDNILGTLRVSPNFLLFPDQRLLPSAFFNPRSTIFVSGFNNDLNITSEELVELINTGTVQNKLIKLIDPNNLRVLQTATGGSNEILENNGNGDNISGIFSGSILTPVNINSQQLAEFITTNSTDINITLIDNNNLITDLSIIGGNNQLLESGQNIDGEVVTLSGGGVSLQILQDIGVFTSSIIFPSEVASSGLTLSLNDNIIQTTYSNGSNIRQFTVNATGQTVVKNPEEIFEEVNTGHITLINNDTGSTLLYDTLDSENPKNNFITIVKLDENNNVLSSNVLARSVSLASAAFTIDGVIHINTIHDSFLQSTYFIIDEFSNIVSKISPGLAGTTLPVSNLPKVSKISDSKVILTNQIKGRTVIDNANFFSVLGVSETILDFNPERPYQNEEIGDILHIAGGFLTQYDGNRTVEHGFHIFPEDLTIEPSTNETSLNPGTYQYSAIYVWTDNRGNLHRSAPSIGEEIILTTDSALQVQIPTLRLTQKDDVVVELYRTEANGTIFYKVSETTIPTENDTTIDFVTIEDIITDQDLISREILYTTGGVLENIAAPSSSIITSFADRVFIAGLEDEHRIQYSKQRFEDQPIEFSDVLTIQLNSRGGPITALSSMDEKLVIFKEQSIFYMSGDGPNNLGQQDSFIKPELVSSDIGCINIDSVVLTPDGLMFQSSKGIYLLSRNLQVSYIGAEVEGFNELTITSAITVPEENQVRFTTINGEALVYNYYFRKWAAYTNHEALNAINVNFTYFYLRSDGILYQENENSFTDNGSSVNIVVESGWISFAGVQAFQRVYKLLLLGEYKSPHKLRIRIAYDFNEAFTQEVIIDTQDFTDDTRYGQNSPYGNPTTTTYGGDGNVHQMRIDLARQKCQSIKIRIEEIQSDLENLGEGLSISNIMFEVGTKQGTNKISTDRQYGTK